MPPKIPKKLRGRPKRLRRRKEWESDSGKKGKNIVNDVPQRQRFSSGRIQHCSICKKTGHRKNKCPEKVVENDDENAHSGGTRMGANEGRTSGTTGKKVVNKVGIKGVNQVV